MTELYSLYLLHPEITTDSRDCPQGSIFFALKGDNFNGNEYAAAALEKGCSYAVIDEAQHARDNRYIVVPDVLTTLQQLANEHRRALGTPVIAVTGTNGKTTTKELIAAVLSRKYNVLYTQGNLNNHIGVPKTLLRLKREHDIAVIEMGANHPGEIRTLADIVEPDFGIITNVGMAHLEGFGSLQGVIRTKGELYDKLRNHVDKKVFIDADNKHLEAISEGLSLIKYAVDTHADDVIVHGEVAGCAPYLTFRWNHGEVKTHLIGAYNIRNMLAAATVGLHFDVEPQQINEALEQYTPSNNRSQLTLTERNTLIVDTYNANPTSMAAALDNFALMPAERKMAILGDMRELGSASREEHQRVVDRLLHHPEITVWLVGQEFGKTACSAATTIRKFPDVAAVKQAIANERPSGRHILIKGSNATRLYELPPLL